MLQHLGAEQEVEGTGSDQGGLLGQHREAAGGGGGLDQLDAGLKAHRDEIAAGQQGAAAAAAAEVEQPQGARRFVLGDQAHEGGGELQQHLEVGDGRGHSARPDVGDHPRRWLAGMWTGAVGRMAHQPVRPSYQRTALRRAVTRSAASAAPIPS